MKIPFLGLACLAGLAGCSLLISVDGLSGGPEANDAGTEPTAETGADAAVDRDGAVPPGTVAVVAHEADRTAAIAVDRTNIYWWSVRDSRIVRASKANPSDATTLAARPGQTVSAMAVDASGVYWAEVGPDEQQPATTNHRIMKVANGALPVTLLRSAAALQRLVLDSTRIATTSPSGLETVTTSGTATHVGVAVDQRTLAADGFNLFYTFGRTTVYRLSQANAPSMMVSGLTAPREIVADSANLYLLITQGGSTAIAKVSKSVSGGKADSAQTLTSFAIAGPEYLAIELDGLAWAGGSDGAVGRISKEGGTSVTIASGQSGLNALAADADGVYWSSDRGDVVWARR